MIKTVVLTFCDVPNCENIAHKICVLCGTDICCIHALELEPSHRDYKDTYIYMCAECYTNLLTKGDK